MIKIFQTFTDHIKYQICSTGKALLEALILASSNPQYDKRLFSDLQVQYMKITSSEHAVYINWCKQTPKLVIFMYWTRNSMNNLLSYCRLVDARISASEKDLTVHGPQKTLGQFIIPVTFLLYFNFNQTTIITNELCHIWSPFRKYFLEKTSNSKSFC